MEKEKYKCTPEVVEDSRNSMVQEREVDRKGGAACYRWFQGYKEMRNKETIAMEKARIVGNEYVERLFTICFAEEEN